MVRLARSNAQLNEGHAQFLGQLTKRGFVKLSAPDKTAAGIEQFLRELTDVLPDAEPPNISPIQPDDGLVSKYLTASHRAISYHNDGVPPAAPLRYVAVACVQPASVGGVTLVVDAAAAVKHLPAAHLAALAAPNWRWYDTERGAPCPPTSCIWDGGIRWWWQALCPSDEEQQQIADGFEATLRNMPQERVKLASGDVLVLDDRRMLHARTRFNGHRLVLTAQWA